MDEDERMESGTSTDDTGNGPSNINGDPERERNISGYSYFSLNVAI